MWTKSFSRYTHILLVSAAVIIGAQISISLFESDFVFPSEFLAFSCL